MTDAQTLAQVILDIELVFAEHVRPGHQHEPQLVIDQILQTMDRANAIAAAERIQAGFTGLTITK